MDNDSGSWRGVISIRVLLLEFCREQQLWKYLGVLLEKLEDVTAKGGEDVLKLLEAG